LVSWQVWRGLLDVAITRLADVPVAETIATAAPVSLRPLGVAVAAPAILVAYVGQVVFSYRLHWLPVHGVHQGWVSYILPSVAVTAASVGYVALVTRRMLADILRELFVTAAVARGMSGRRIIAAQRVAAGPAVDRHAGRRQPGRAGRLADHRRRACTPFLASAA
jgi:hypothetical protein